MGEAAIVVLRPLKSLEDCRAVVAIQEAVWGVEGETVPASVLLVSAKRGGILIGAFSGATLAGFVWSLPGSRDGVPTHWSHMLAVLPAFRSARIGERLKIAQREQALAQGVGLIEWTFDPLQAGNAHFNLHVLGAVGTGYGENVYGLLQGSLHRGTPTDRLIVEWTLNEPHVTRRLAHRAGSPGAAIQPRSAEILDVPVAIHTEADRGWVRPVGHKALVGRRILVPVPPRFLEMQQQATDVALEWRFALRDVMGAAIASGYRAIDFFANRDEGGGNYLLAKSG